MQPSGAVLPGSGERRFVAERLLAPEQAIVAYFARAELASPRGERVALDAAGGRVLAADVVAREDHPSHPRSTMDGFAVQSGGGRSRRITGEVRMGAAAPRAIASGEALRIPTGGALPEGADAVVALEDVDERDGSIDLRVELTPGENVAPRGGDLRRGERILDAGRRIGAPELGVLATLGYGAVDVFARPRFGIISTGDELIDVEADATLGQIRDSNRYALAGTLRALGAEAIHLPRAPDDPIALRLALESALASCNGVLLTGGSSVGERDFVPRVVAALGAPGPIVHGLRVKPGKPTLLAAVGGKPIVGLPGNPTSSLMILEAVARPIVTALCGERHARAATIDAVAAREFSGREGWTWYVPARVTSDGTRCFAQPLPLRSSHTSLLARATGYVTLDELRPKIESGAPVRVTAFSSGGAPIENARASR